MPSLAIKEGVLKNLEITKEHFEMLFEKPAMNCPAFDPSDFMAEEKKIK